MTDEQPTKPTLWQRITSNVKNFFSHAIGYIPRGIVLTAFVFAISAALESFTNGAFGLGITGLSNPGLLSRFAGHLAIGSMVSGFLGATLPPCTPCAHTEGGMQAHANPMLSTREAQLGEYMAKTMGDHMASTAVETIIPGGGLPAHLATAAARAATTGRGG